MAQPNQRDTNCRQTNNQQTNPQKAGNVCTMSALSDLVKTALDAVIHADGMHVVADVVTSTVVNS
jgi:hypothetical protein